MRGPKSLLPVVVAVALTSCSRAPDDERMAKTTTTSRPAPNVIVAEYRTTDEPELKPASNTSVENDTPAAASPPANSRSNPPPEKSMAPREWVRLHRTALQPGTDGWKDAIATLQIVGDGFTVEHLKRVRVDRLSEEDRELLSSCQSSIEDRVSSEDEQTAAKMVLPRLERAAYCDLTSNPLETVLVQWTLAKLRSQAQLPKVRARLEEIAAGYKPETSADNSGAEPEPMFGSMSERVPLYVGRILDQTAR